MARVFVIAGHGAGDCGAVGNGYTEAERVRSLANRIKSLGGDDVMLGDTSRNWYEDNGISQLTIPKDYQIAELHTDSSDAASARGGHVIIQAGIGGADQYDNALANYISTAFPGRVSKIVERNDLANPSRAYKKGYGYRLIECGFITNATDIKIFNDDLDKHAAGILAAFGIKTAGTTAVTDVDGDIKSGGTSQSGTDKRGAVTYRGWMRDKKWGAWQCDGGMVGSIGQNRRLEAIQIDADDALDVVVHLKDLGDKTYNNVTKDTLIGTTDQSRRMEAINESLHPPMDNRVREACQYISDHLADSNFDIASVAQHVCLSPSRLSHLFRQQLGISVLPMPFFINGETLFEDINLTQDTFYEHLTDGAEISTSMPAVGDLTDRWDELNEEICGDDSKTPVKEEDEVAGGTTEPAV